MKAVLCVEHGPPESLVVREVADPGPGPGQVVVDVAYAAVNFPDVLIIADRYQVSVPPPFVPGSEFSGLVTAVGADVDGIAVGQRVFGSSMTGAFAERIALPAGSVRSVPDGVALADAAGFWVAHATAYHALRSFAEVRPGERVVVLGASGGVGLAAVELAAGLGARVIAAASSDAKLAICRDRGAHRTINYATHDLRAALRDEYPDGVDVVIDPVGGALAERALRALRWRGRFVTVGFASGEIPRIPLNLVLLKGCSIHGFQVRMLRTASPELANRGQRELLGLLERGAVSPHISAVFRLDDTAQALAWVAARRAVGKVLVQP